jgi:hypothetical protein
VICATKHDAIAIDLVLSIIAMISRLWNILLLVLLVFLLQLMIEHCHGVRVRSPSTSVHSFINLSVNPSQGVQPWIQKWSSNTKATNTTNE